MFQAFKAFINRGNVLDLAVAVIIGAAFGKIVTSLTDDVIMPVIGKITGDLDFSSLFIRLGAIPADFKGSATSYADLKGAGVPMIGYGQFITVAVQFVIVAFVVFLIVRAANKVFEKPEAPKADPAEVVLLREILEELKKKG
ncbi:large conductance mechanosensitive channel protein MscL [Sphingomonas sp. ID0503]|uniref:large conductance mechanosensitive channel protein MscL n=1 Tax=Sphingomonas sp. ID0503 TaxID=3399691 RepID=UPI003AFAA603